MTTQKATAARKSKGKTATARKTTGTPKSKPPAGRKPTPSGKKNGAMLEAAREILPLLKKGQTTLSAERDRLGLSGNGPLRKALTEVLGSKKAYQEMMAAHSGHRFRKRTSAPKGK